jgi:hypothetical protein
MLGGEKTPSGTMFPVFQLPKDQGAYKRGTGTQRAGEHSSQKDEDVIPFVIDVVVPNYSDVNVLKKTREGKLIITVLFYYYSTYVLICNNKNLEKVKKSTVKGRPYPHSTGTMKVAPCKIECGGKRIWQIVRPLVFDTDL